MPATDLFNHCPNTNRRVSNEHSIAKLSDKSLTNHHVSVFSRWICVENTRYWSRIRVTWCQPRPITMPSHWIWWIFWKMYRT